MSPCLTAGNVNLGSLVNVVCARFLNYKITVSYFVNYKMFWGNILRAFKYPVFS